MAAPRCTPCSTSDRTAVCTPHVCNGQMVACGGVGLLLLLWLLDRGPGAPQQRHPAAKNRSTSTCLQLGAQQFGQQWNHGPRVDTRFQFASSTAGIAFGQRTRWSDEGRVPKQQVARGAYTKAGGRGDDQEQSGAKRREFRSPESVGIVRGGSYRLVEGEG